MQAPPLQLNNYFFPVVSVLAHQNFRPEMAEGKPGPQLICDLDASSEDGKIYQVNLGLRIEHTEDNPSQYNILLRAIGIFTVSPALEGKNDIVKAAAASILYSASREFLLSLMYRGPWTPIMLNLMTFRPDNLPPTHSEALRSKDEII